MDVRPSKKVRRNPVNVQKYKFKSARVPRAIQTRGTPEGYYDIPYHQMVRLYCNTSSGFGLRIKHQWLRMAEPAIKVLALPSNPTTHVSRSVILELLRRMKILVFLISLAFRRSLMMLNLLRLPLKHGLMLNRQILLLPCRMLLKFGHVMTQMTVIPYEFYSRIC